RALIHTLSLHDALPISEFLDELRRLLGPRILDEVANPGEELLHLLILFAESLLVFPVRRDASLGDLVHLGRPNLYLDAPPFRSEHRGVQTLIAVRFGYGNEVPKALGQRLVQVRNDGVDAPAILFAFFAGTLEHDAKGKEVVDFLERLVLPSHLAEDRVNVLRAA